MNPTDAISPNDHNYFNTNVTTLETTTTINFNMLLDYNTYRYNDTQQQFNIMSKYSIYSWSRNKLMYFQSMTPFKYNNETALEMMSIFLPKES